MLLNRPFARSIYVVADALSCVHGRPPRALLCSRVVYLLSFVVCFLQVFLCIVHRT